VTARRRVDVSGGALVAGLGKWSGFQPARFTGPVGGGVGAVEGGDGGVDGPADGGATGPVWPQRCRCGRTCPVGRTAAIHSAPPSSASTTSAISSRRGQDSEAIDPGTVCRVRDGAGLGAGVDAGVGLGSGSGSSAVSGSAGGRCRGAPGRETGPAPAHPNGLDTEGHRQRLVEETDPRREPSARRWRGASVSVSRCGLPVSPSWCRARHGTARLGPRRSARPRWDMRWWAVRRRRRACAGLPGGRARRRRCRTAPLWSGSGTYRCRSVGGRHARRRCVRRRSVR